MEQKIKHWKNEKGGYYCVGEEKNIARTLKEVTCKNCVKLLKNKVKGKKNVKK